jgi:hypothetical protein
LGLIVPELSYILCLTEHHLKEQENESFSIDHYTLGAKFGRKILKKEVKVFLYMNLSHSPIFIYQSFV